MRSKETITVRGALLGYVIILITIMTIITITYKINTNPKLQKTECVKTGTYSKDSFTGEYAEILNCEGK